MAHGALDRLGRVRPRALVVRVVVAPHEVVDEAGGLGQSQPGRVLLERCEPVLAEILAGQLRQLGTDPEVMLLVSLVHRVEDRKSTRLNSSHGSISYAVFCLK